MEQAVSKDKGSLNDFVRGRRMPANGLEQEEVIDLLSQEYESKNDLNSKWEQAAVDNILGKIHSYYLTRFEKKKPIEIKSPDSFAIRRLCRWT